METIFDSTGSCARLFLVPIQAGKRTTLQLALIYSGCVIAF